MSEYTDTTERFVSLQGYFAIHYPKGWLTEIDEQGHYLFSNPNGGHGIIRLLSLPHNYSGADGALQIQADILAKQSDYGAHYVAQAKEKCISYVQLHDMNGIIYRVAYFAIPSADKVWLLTYTIQDMMKELPAAVAEMHHVINMARSFEYLGES